MKFDDSHNIYLSFSFIFSYLILQSTYLCSLLTNLHLNAAEPLLIVSIVMLEDGDVSLYSSNLLFLLHELRKLNQTSHSIRGAKICSYQTFPFFVLIHVLYIETSSSAEL